MTMEIFNADALRPKYVRLYGGNGTYGVYIVFADQSDVPSMKVLVPPKLSTLPQVPPRISK